MVTLRNSHFLLVKAKVKADETVSKRQHLSTIPENPNKSVSIRQVITNQNTALHVTGLY